MSKNETKKKKLKRQKYLRTRALAILVVVGVGAMLGMALFNGHAKPNRDMHWYMKPGAMDVAVPGPSDGYVVAEANVGQRDGSATPALAELEASPDAEGSADIPADAEASGASAASEAGDVAAEVSDGTESLDPADDSAQDAADAFEDGESGEADAETAVEEIPTGPVTITVTAAGDCTFGGQDGAKGRRRFMEYAKDYGYDYFFNGVRSIFENDDLTIVNLEGPLTRLDRTDRHANFIFHGDPEYANILTGSSVELCNVANNHSRDYGTEGLKETASVLDAAGVGYCGYNKAYYTTIKGVRVGALGFTWWDYNTRQMSKAVAEVRKNCDLLIVSVHWGEEYEYDQSPRQEEMGRAMIDAGADLVVGTHPHVFQGIEKYKGKYIVYSLGNFCFAGNANPADKRCIIFQQTFSFTPGMGIAQAGILDDGINIIPTFISSRSDLNDFQPTVMDAGNGGKLLKSIARHSKGFTFEDTAWMPDNYVVTNGLIGVDSADGEAGAEDADGET